MTDLEESTGGAGNPPESLWRRPAVWAGAIAIVVSLLDLAIDFGVLGRNVLAVVRRFLEELGLELGALGLLAFGAWVAGRLGDGRESLWGRLSVWAGVVAIVMSLVIDIPLLGGGVPGELRLALTTLGLVAIGAGLTALLWHNSWHAAGKTAAVVSTVAAIGALVFFGVDQVPIWPESCATAEAPTLENAGPVYCHEGDGTLVRMTIGNVRQCPDGSVIWNITRAKRWQSAWYAELPGKGCPL